MATRFQQQFEYCIQRELADVPGSVVDAAQSIGRTPTWKAQ